jgi:large subunit ribosomal protein L22
MEAVAKAKFIRITPKKAAQVLQMISGKDVETAQRILTFVPKKGARFAEKLLRSAVANAVDRDSKVDVADLYVSEASVGRGVIMKRWLPRAQGRATPILKRTSHITIKVATRGA